MPTLALAPPPCFYCGGTQFLPLFRGVRDRLGYVPGKWAFLRCQRCGSAVLMPHPRPEDLAAFYPPVYGFVPDPPQASGFRKKLAHLEYKWFFQKQYQSQVSQVLSGIDKLPGDPPKMLDIGCGRGLRLLGFREKGFEVHGMDFQPEVVDYVRQHLHIPAEVSDIDGLSRKFPTDAFDLVTAFLVMEHVPDVKTMLRQVWNLLRPGGWFVAVVPLVDCIQAEVLGTRWVNVTEAPRHLSLPSQAGLLHVCREMGYDRVHLKPDALMACAALVGLSLAPGGATTHAYGGSRLKALMLRLVAAGISLLAVPWSALDNYVLRRPPHGMVFARKPA